MTQKPKAKYRHVLSVDIVGLSRPILTEEEQAQKIEILNRSLMECEVFKNVQKEEMILRQTGDGFIIGASGDPTFPIELAIQLQEKLQQYNQTLDIKHQIKIRMGIHSGTSYQVKGLTEDEWGDAFIGATRVMSVGKSDHILLSSKTALELIHLSTRYEQILHSIGEYT
ncbi:MAG: adenylate/guanylate cyclase domain-containing protein, partial [Nitrososphaeraceae archaeon]